VPDGATYIEAATASGQTGRRATIGDLFAPAFARDTIGLFGAFFFGLMVNYVVIQLVPSMLREYGGFTPAAAASGLQWSNIGGVAGAIVGALVIQRLGSRATMLGMSAAAVVCSLVMAGLRLDSTDTFALMAMFLVTGGLLNTVQVAIYALAAHVYPTSIRGTGIGAAVAFGRIGNVLAVYVGREALNRGGPAGYFTSWAVLMGLVFLSLALVRRHVPRSVGAS
ncbi:MAG: MFS transporter, partial [Vicinamibacteraceae bacterium]